MRTPIKEFKKIWCEFTAFLLCFGLLCFAEDFNFSADENTESPVADLMIIEPSKAVSVEIPVELGSIVVNAKACLLMEASTGKVLYAKTADVKLPMASTTKIMTTLLTLESGSLDTSFVVNDAALRVEGSTMGLSFGDLVTKRALCYGMMLPSGNDAANAAAYKLGCGNSANNSTPYESAIANFGKMANDRALEIGMTHTFFVTPSGLQDEKHGASAYDMALLTREALKNPDFAEICKKQRALVNFGNPPFDRYLTNTNKLLAQYPYCIGVKTGFTDEAGRCLVSAAEKDGVTLICVTLNAPDDWHDHAALYNAAFPIVKKADLPLPPNLTVSVIGANTDELALSPKRSASIAGIGANAVDGVSYKLIIPPFVYANTLKKISSDGILYDKQIGWLEYYYNDLLVDRIELFAKT